MKTTAEYRDIEGYPGYRAGDDGSVWSCWKNNGKRPRTISDVWRELRATKSSGYLSVSLCRDGKVKTHFVHRLITVVFIGPRPDGLECCHDDGNPLNNRVANLRWDTHKSNAADKAAHGTAQRGERNGHAKLAVPQVLEIRQSAASGESQRSIGRRLGVDQTTVSLIVRRRTWAHVAAPTG